MHVDFAFMHTGRRHGSIPTAPDTYVNISVLRVKVRMCRRTV